jgi:hypothetical protein
MQKEDLLIDITFTPVSFRWTVPLNVMSILVNAKVKVAGLYIKEYIPDAKDKHSAWFLWQFLFP